jgi:ABC-type bacteriocin/lantibiotic exporter with double-glycine peptidase domain
VCKYWADRVPHKSLCHELLTTEDGTELHAIEIWFRRRGYQVLSGSMTLGDLRWQTRQGRPVITPVTIAGHGHYVVVAGLSRGQVWYHDSDRGPHRVLEAEFASIWHGISKTADFPQWGISVWCE